MRLPTTRLPARYTAPAAVEARRPAAVVLLVPGQGVLPVLPEPVRVQAGVEVVPGQHLALVALPGGVPAQVDADLAAGADPPFVREMLRPAVEPAAQLPHPADHRAHAAVAPREQPFDLGRLA